MIAKRRPAADSDLPFFIIAPVPDQPQCLQVWKITPEGAFAYVMNGNSDNVSVIDTASNTVTATVTVGRGPIGVATLWRRPTLWFLTFRPRPRCWTPLSTRSAEGQKA